MKKQELVLFSWTALFQALVNKLSHCWEGGGGGGVVAWVNFCWVCATCLSEPFPIIVYSVANYRPHLSHFWTNM